MIYAIPTLLLGFFLVLWAHDARLRQRINAELPETGTYISVPTAHLHYLEAGADKKSDDRPSIILLHGSSGSSFDMMATLGGKLASQFHVLSFDRPGIANSRNRISNHDMSDPRRQAGAIYAAADALGSKTRLSSDIAGAARWQRPMPCNMGTNLPQPWRWRPALSVAGAGQLV